MRNTLAQGKDLTEMLIRFVSSNRTGDPVGLYSICSANRFVLEAGMLQAKEDESILCIESTSNQVNQFGGYSGMSPEAFAHFVKAVARSMSYPPERILLGGDHLGPHVWKDEPASTAMAKARELVRSYIQAGYVKIHIDASMRCADDPGDERLPLDDEKIAERTALLCHSAEEAFAGRLAGSPAPVYVIGTEVPSPGGAVAGAEGLAVTEVKDVERTITLMHDAFLSRGLATAWERVAAVVVQPGVEFGNTTVVEYDPEKARPLSSYIEKNWHLVFEAHSTDYQKPQALSQMVRDHFAILKVGPWLTFAFREAVFALAEVEREWLSGRRGTKLSGVREALEEAMLANPASWKKYYSGDEASLQFARKYSYSDRSRYYWPQPGVSEALQRLLANLSEKPAPLTIISQYLPVQYQAIREGRIASAPQDLIRDKIMEVVEIYARACGMR